MACSCCGWDTWFLFTPIVIAEWHCCILSCINLVPGTIEDQGEDFVFKLEIRMQLLNLCHRARNNLQSCCTCLWQSCCIAHGQPMIILSCPVKLVHKMWSNACSVWFNSDSLLPRAFQQAMWCNQVVKLNAVIHGRSPWKQHWLKSFYHECHYLILHWHIVGPRVSRLSNNSLYQENP